MKFQCDQGHVFIHPAKHTVIETDESIVEANVCPFKRQNEIDNRAFPETRAITELLEELKQ